MHSVIISEIYWAALTDKLELGKGQDKFYTLQNKSHSETYSSDLLFSTLSFCLQIERGLKWSSISFSSASPWESLCRRIFQAVEH